MKGEKKKVNRKWKSENGKTLRTDSFGVTVDMEILRPQTGRAQADKF
jgi:hypothetical protein